MTTRFKRRSYRGENSKGDVPKWHLARYDYKKGEVYRAYTALCGYKIDNPWLSDIQLSYAKKVSGPSCSKCTTKGTP